MSIICLTLSDELLADIYDILSTVFGDSSITEIKDSSGTDYHEYGSYVYDEDGHWKVCSICGNKTASESHTLVNDICTVCGYEYHTTSEGIEYTLSDDGTYYIVTGIGTCTDTDIVIPYNYNGLPVTEIAKSAFKDQTQIISIYINNNVNKIGYGAFSGCSSLESMTLPVVSYKSNDMQYHFGYLFGGSNYAGSIGISQETTYLHNPLLSYGYGAMYYIPATLKTININCVGIIEPSAFINCTSIESVNIGSSVTSIGYSAFNGCTSLTNITIPDSVTSIGSNAFYNCTSLKYYEYDNGYYLGNDDNNYVVLVDVIDTSVKSFNINNRTKFIYDYAFSDCTSLTNITIPDSVTSIGAAAFEDCTSLKYYEYNNGYYLGNGNNNYVVLVDVIDTSAKSFNIYKNTKIIYKSAFSSCTSLTSVTIPDSVTFIGDYAFSGCTSLTSITIPNGVTTIGISAFNSCTSLTSVSIPDSVTSIGIYAFYKCTSLTSITIPDSVTSIGYEAFFSCTSLTNLIIGNGVTTICDNTFQNCTSLISVTIGNGVTSIGIYAFYKCTSLTSLTIPDSVTFISRYAFRDCSSLISVTIGNGVTSIYDNAFSGCTSLTSVTFKNTNGWYVVPIYSGESNATISSSDLANTATAAKYLRSTYSKYSWYRK